MNLPVSPETGVMFCVCGMGFVGTKPHGATEVRRHAEFRVSGGEPGSAHDPGAATFRADTHSVAATPTLDDAWREASRQLPEWAAGEEWPVESSDEARRRVAQETGRTA